MPQLNTASAPGCRAGGPRRGAILLLVAVVMLALSVLALAVLSLADANGLQQIHNQQATGAFWIAEGGVHYTLANLKSRSEYRSSANPSNLTGTVGGGVYTSVVTKTGTKYDIRSTGFIADSRRTVRILIDVRDDGWPLAFSDYALFSGTGNIGVGKDSTIIGDVYGNTVASSVVTAVGTNGTVQDSTSYTNPPATPPLDTSYYDGLISTAAGWSGPALTYPLNLGGGTKYVKGNASIGDITGPGILAVSGNISLSKDVVIAAGVRLVCGGTLTIDKGFNAGTNCLLFARGGPLPVNTANNAIIIAKEGMSLTGCAIITPASISVQKDLTFSGIVYAGGNINLAKDCTLEGSMVAGGNISTDKNFEFTQNPDVFPTPPPPGFTGEVVIQQVLWEDDGTGGP